MKKNKLIIGVAGLIDFKSKVNQEIVSGIEKAVNYHNLNLINFISVIRYSFGEDIENYSLYRNKLLYLNKNNIDGLITLSTTFQYFMTRKEIENFHQSLSTLPVVSLGIPIKNVSSMIHDNFFGINELMNHLVNYHGYKKIAFIGSKGSYSYEERLKAYKKTLLKFNIAYRPELVYIINDVDSKKQVKNCLDIFFNNRKLAIKKDIEAFITVTDIIAKNLIEELDLIKVKVPYDVAVTGFNNKFESLKSFPPITTVDPHFFNIGYKAVELLISKIDGDRKTEIVQNPLKMIVRQSCGCFEDIIKKASHIENKINPASARECEEITFSRLIKENYEKIMAVAQIKNPGQNISLDGEYIATFLDCLMHDVDNKSSEKCLNEINKYLFNYKIISEEKLELWQNIITEIRNFILPLCENNLEYIHRADSIFHQVRIMIYVAYNYLILLKKQNINIELVMAHLAADLAGTGNVDEIITVLKKHLSELEIPGFYLALFDEPKDNISKSILLYADKHNENFMLRDKKEIIPVFHLVPKKLLPEKRRYSMIFEILCYKGMFLGFALFEMGPDNITVYDSLRIILNSSIFKILMNQKELNSNKEKKLLSYDIDIKKNNLKGSDKNFNHKELNHENKTLTASKILEYLSNNIDKPTDLSAIAENFNLSLNSLMSKTKLLTGYTLQKLHEKLKIEKAKLLLENNVLSISEITEQLGYQNQFYFSSVFKKHTGMSPRKWINFNIRGPLKPQI